MKNVITLFRFALLGAVLAYCCLVKSDEFVNSSVVTTQYKANHKLDSSLRFESPDNSESFISRGQGYAFSLTPTAAVFSVANRNTADLTSSFPKRLRHEKAVDGDVASAKSVKLTMEIVGANAMAAGAGEGQLASRSHYFVGNDPTNWKSNVVQFSRVRYQDVYPGVSLVYYGNQGQLEYDFVVAPNADSGQIKLGFADAKSVTITEDGELRLLTEAGEMHQHKPIVYQHINGQRHEIGGRYVMQGEQSVAFEVGEYDKSKELIIDPVLIYSTYLGGSDLEYGNSVEVDAAGNIYVTGVTYSQDLMTKGAIQPFLRGYGNAFVSKFDSEGKLLYSTYLGGSGEDTGFNVVAEASGNVYVSGMTDSSDFPVKSGAAQAARRGRLDAFVAKLNADGSEILYSTFLGGSDDEVIGAMVVDPQGNVYLTGETLSNDFPTRSALQSARKGGADSFVAKLNSSGSQFVYATYMGGNGSDYGFGIAVDGAGNAYVTGATLSTDFPTRTPVQATTGGRVDTFLSKLNASGNGLVYSTYLGGSHDDLGYGVVVNGAGEAAITGFTTSVNFPTKNPIQSANAGGDDVIFARFDKDGGLDSSSYLGGSSDDRAFDLAINPSGDFYLAGRTESANFPVKDAIQPKLNFVSVASNNSGQLRDGEKRQQSTVDLYQRDSNRIRPDFQASNRAGLAAVATETAQDGFVVKINKSGTVNYSTFFGGGDIDKVYGVAVDAQGNAYLAGVTASGNFPIRGAVQSRLRGLADSFIAKIADSGNTHASVSAASYVASSLAPQQIAAAFGVELADSTNVASATPLPTTLAGVSVSVKDSAGTEKLAPLFFVSPGQINFAMPDGLVNGQAQIAISKNGMTVSTESKLIESVSPGLFSAASSGSGLAAAVVLRVKADGSQRYEAVSRFDSALGRFVAVPVDLGDISSGEQVYLLLFGTGLRGRSSLTGVTVSMGGTSVPVFYAGAQGDFVGLDQINIGPLSRNMIGRGEVDVVSIVDGKSVNVVKLNFK